MSSAPRRESDPRGEHPSCPDCGYDLVGSVRAGGRVCPECGCEFTLRGLARAAKVKWTPALGARRAAASLAVKALILLPACTGLLWLVTPSLWSPPYWGTVLVLAIAGFAVGSVACVNLAERSGLSSLVLTVVAAAFVWGIVLVAAILSHLMRPLPDWPAFYTQTTVAIFGTIWIVKTFVLE